MDSLRHLPVSVCYLLATGGLMLLPAAVAASANDPHGVQSFVFASLITIIVTIFVAIATMGRPPKSASRSQLFMVLASFVVLPAIAAAPVMTRMGIPFEAAYFEMLAAMTTTGATQFDAPDSLPVAINLWRSLVGWFGGFAMLLAAFAILEPLHLGGFELRANTFGGRLGHADARARIGGAPNTVARTAAAVFPLYLAATAVLTLLLIVAGDPGFVAMCHAMAILSTSGISPIGGLSAAPSGVWGEIAIFLFFVFAISHRFFDDRHRRDAQEHRWFDAEMRLAVILILSATAVVFIRHLVLSLDATIGDPLASLQALWGIAFTFTSFLTTTGFDSSLWAGIETWSGLKVTGVAVMTLAVMGGGIATTAGGIKLLRVYALHKHGMREMERLVHPSSIGGAGTSARQVRREGAYIAWMFLMIFFLSIAIGAAALSMLGQGFEAALILTISALSNNGPLAAQFGPDVPGYAALSSEARSVLAVLMVLGRMEALAVIALINPEYWRR